MSVKGTGSLMGAGGGRPNKKSPFLVCFSDLEPAALSPSSVPKSSWAEPHCTVGKRKCPNRHRSLDSALASAKLAQPLASPCSWARALSSQDSGMKGGGRPAPTPLAAPPVTRF